MLLAAGRGERMRPLTDHTPKPLLAVQGKALIDWHLEKLAAAGIGKVVINVAHLADQILAHCGDGSRWDLRLLYSREAEALETAGGIATALPLLGEGCVPIVSADVFTDYDYGQLVERARIMSASTTGARLHLVMVDNPEFHAQGDFCLEDGRLSLTRGERLTFASMGVYDLSLFRGLPRNTKLKLTPFYREWVSRGVTTGERYRGTWYNLGTPEQLAHINALSSSQKSGKPQT